jgi:dihydroorotate dehydrogenase electron transfer subunit
MHLGEGDLAEIFLGPYGPGGRILCPSELIPAPGQYLLVQNSISHATRPDAPLPAPVFPAGSTPGGFLAAAPLPSVWTPGTHLHLRGPLGHGFSVPPGVRRVALWAFDGSPDSLRPLIPAALGQAAALVMISEGPAFDLPEEVEVQPLGAADEVLVWADYLAVAARRASLDAFRERFREHAKAAPPGEILVGAPLPCGGLADCGVCAVTIRAGWQMACKDGPVFDLKDVLG